MLYAISSGFFALTTSMMARRSVHLGGKHIHYLFCLRIEIFLSPPRMAEIAIVKLLRMSHKLNVLRLLNILFVDEIGQVSAELLSVLDIILGRIRDSNIFMGGLLIITMMDHTQL